MKAAAWVVSALVLVLALVILGSRSGGSLESFVARLPVIGKPVMPDVTGAVIVELYENPCGDGRNGAVKVLSRAGKRPLVGFYLSDDPEHPFAVQDRETRTLYLDLNRDGRVDEIGDGARTICDDVRRVPHRTSRAPVILPDRSRKVVL
jgi:hypothetical protein